MKHRYSERLAGLLVGTALLGVAIVGAGCGDDQGTSNAHAAGRALDPVEQCLTGAGAVRAGSVSDIRLFAKDYERGETDKSAGAGNGIAEVAEFEASEVIDPTDRPPVLRYLLFVGQPPGEDINPLSAVDDQRSDTFVLYLSQPTKEEQVAAQQCLDNFGAAAARDNARPQPALQATGS